jgi:heat shock protein HslJ
MLVVLPHSATSSATASLENTYWKLTYLGDRPIHAASQAQEAHFVLNSESRRVSGSGGCNPLVGSYELNADKLTFRQIAGTLMACLEGMDTEKAFLNVLNQAKRWKITGQQLELLDGSGHSLARLEARHTK